LQRIAAPDASQAEMEYPGLGPAVSEAPIEGAESQPVLQQERARKRRPVLPAQFRKNFRVESAEESTASPPPRDERLPDLDLLVDERVSRPDERNINMTAGLIEKTLAEFGIPAKVVGFRVGPTVTQFAVEPGYVERDKPGVEGDPDRSKVRVSQISSLARDLALALAAERLRIEAPVPGRPYVGIEVPNTRSTVVRLRPILETEAFYKIGSPLAIALGRDVSGLPVIADLALMPHLLIAGTTGSGKSVCIAALTACLAMNNTPDDLRIVMVDPKMVELVRFNGLPHLYGKVETDLERILGVLRWVVVEMDKRYRLLEATRSRNIDTYNRKARRRKGVEPLPHIVLMIDELADLMMSAPDQTEHNLVRLAQMARATGIHLVIATQRPSTDVVTGLIKANFPARLSFAVASSIDSRVILDTTGAESLLGRGDMLFLPPEASGPVRVQGVMVTDQEVERVITYWRNAIQVDDQAEQPPWEEMLEQEQMLADRDDLVEKAIKIVRDSQSASASMLQRRLRIGYPRAARLMDELEELGVVGPSVSGGRQREILLSPEDDLPDWEEE
jgi:S-DNA-T family DNA segregation ATPase FtsK/SpoIIIE